MADFSAAELEITELPEREAMLLGISLSVGTLFASVLGIASVFLSGLTLGL